MKNSLSSRLFTSLVLATLSATAAAAGPVLLTNAWQTEPFTSMTPGAVFPTAYQASVGEVVYISGYYVTGDYYRVYVNGAPVLTTTQVTPTDVDYGDQTPPLYADPASAFSSGLFSTGQFDVSAGDLITIADLYPPGGIGELAIEAAPEPGALTLLLAGAGLLAASRGRRVPRSHNSTTTLQDKVRRGTMVLCPVKSPQPYFGFSADSLTQSSSRPLEYRTPVTLRECISSAVTSAPAGKITGSFAPLLSILRARTIKKPPERPSPARNQRQSEIN